MVPCWAVYRGEELEAHEVDVLIVVVVDDVAVDKYVVVLFVLELLELAELGIGRNLQIPNGCGIMDFDEKWIEKVSAVVQ
jgi:hypothetical protein